MGLTYVFPTQNLLHLKERGLSLRVVHTFLKKREFSSRKGHTIFKQAWAKPSLVHK